MHFNKLLKMIIVQLLEINVACNSNNLSERKQ